MQTFHHVLLHWSNGVALDIEWAGGKRGERIPSPDAIPCVECTSELAPDALGQRGIPAICWREESEALFEPLQLRENTDYLVDVILPVSFDHARTLWESNRTWPFSQRLKAAYKSDPPKRWHVVNEGVRVTGRLNFGSHVGLADLTPSTESPLVVEVACAKVGYFDDFRALLDSITQELVQLLLQIDGTTFLRFNYAEVRSIDPIILLFHLRRVMSEGRLPLAVETVLQSPHNALEEDQRNVPIGRIRNPLAGPMVVDVLDGRFSVGGPLAHLFGGYTPETLPEKRKRDTFDTPENRYVKAFLENLLHVSETLHNDLSRTGKDTSAREVLRWTSELTDWLSRPFWREVGSLTHYPSNSQVLQKRNGYREVLETDLLIQLGLRLPWSRGKEIGDGLDGDIRPINELYEYWCFFVLRSILRGICGQENTSRGSLIRVSQDGLSLNLRRGIQSKLEFVYSKRDYPEAQVYLYYNRRFSRTSTWSSVWIGSYSAGFQPDYSILIELRNAGAQVQRHWLHFDAKYRLELQDWRATLTDATQAVEQEILTETNEDVERRELYKRGDLYKMHTYRDALLGSRGAYVLFPGSTHQEEVFIRHPTAQYPTSDYYIPSVGAFQLRPEQEEGQKSHLRGFISSVLDQLVEQGSVYKEEMGLF